MQVLITGGMGVIGSAVSRYFVSKGVRPVIYARGGDERLITDISDDVQVELGDVLDLPRLMQVVIDRQITHIIHMAAMVGAVSAANPHRSIQVNVVGTSNVLEVARLMKLRRVVYTSAKGVYGAISGENGYPHYLPLTETMPTNPLRIYDAAKVMCEHMCSYYARALDVDTVSLRFSSTYGPGKTARHGSIGVLSQLVESPFLGRPVSIAQGGDEQDDFIYVDDCAKAIYLATMIEKPQDRLFNIGTGVGRRITDYAQAIRKHLPNADISIGPGLNFWGLPFPACGIFDTTRAREQLGFEAEFDLDRGIGAYIARLRMATQS
jgi:UDP-glucose 4-epimerase